MGSSLHRQGPRLAVMSTGLKNRDDAFVWTLEKWYLIPLNSLLIFFFALPLPVQTC